MYESARREHPGSPAFVVAEEDGPVASYDWGELLDLAAAQGEAMVDAGVPGGSLVAVEGSQGVHCLASFLAVWQRGGAVVPIDPQWGGWLSKRVLSHARVAGYVNASGEVTAADGPATPVGPDWAIISYTSGTTGDPKGVILGHEQLFHAYTAGATELSRVAGSLPKRIACAMRVSGMGVFGIHHLWAALMGATLIMVPELTLFTAASYWSVMVREGAEVTYLVPPLVALLEHAGRPPESGSLPVCLTGGAPLSPALQERFQRRFDTPLFNFYGLTEVGFTAFFGARAADGMAGDEIGLPGTVLARLRDADGHLVAAVGGSGELELAGPALALGYHQDEVAWEEAMRDGWLVTGDIATRSPEGLYRITGRAKDAVMRGGFVIYLHEVEAAALEVPGVVEAGALMLEGADQMEDIGLVVYSDRLSPSSDAQHVRSALVEMVGPGRAPRRVVITNRPLARISQGKLDRRALASQWEQLTQPEAVVQ
jgi:acyl-CoA synthetase (AMP-forming)/AMP-acid ligase II